MSVRAKFTCTSKDEAGNVNLFPVGGGSSENDEFFSATPNGQIRLGIGNTRAAEQFKVSQSYYIDFTPAEG
jgi:hypothetical protein